MHFWQVEDRRYAQLERLRREPGLAHAFATRPTDVSPRSGDGAEARAARRQQVAQDLGLDPQRLSYCQQVHQGSLAVVEVPLAGGLLPRCDGVITAVTGVPLMTFSADCPLVLVYDPIRHVVGLAHASWRCTVTRITLRLAKLMTERFGCRGGDLMAGIGPGAGPCCYEVQRDVHEAAATLPDRDQCFQERGGRLYFDLWEANRRQLLVAGLPPESIETAGVCTMCRNDVFYSFRREGPGCGHSGLMAGLRAT